MGLSQSGRGAGRQGGALVPARVLRQGLPAGVAWPPGLPCSALHTSAASGRCHGVLHAQRTLLCIWVSCIWRKSWPRCEASAHLPDINHRCAPPMLLIYSSSHASSLQLLHCAAAQQRRLHSALRQALALYGKPHSRPSPMSRVHALPSILPAEHSYLAQTAARTDMWAAACATG